MMTPEQKRRLRRLAVELERQKERLADRELELLRSFGWSSVCGNPGALWLMEMKIKGKTYRTDRGSALYMTRSLLINGF